MAFTLLDTSWGVAKDWDSVIHSRTSEIPAMGAAHRHEVMTTPMSGVTGLSSSVNAGKNWLRSRPALVGAMTTLRTDIIMPMPSTSTVAPAKILTRRGVMKTAVTVEARVMSTDRGRSPPAIKVATFEAWPPGQQARRISPVPRGLESCKDCASTHPRRGLTMYCARGGRKSLVSASCCGAMYQQPPSRAGPNDASGSREAPRLSLRGDGLRDRNKAFK